MTLIAALPAAAQQFSADIVIERPGTAIASQRLYVGAGKVRIEAGEGEEPAIVIVDLAGQSAMILSPQQRAFTRMRRPGRTLLMLPADPADPCPAWQAMTTGFGIAATPWRCLRLEERTMAGRHAIRYRARLPDGSAREGWLDPSLGFFLRLEDGQGGEIRLEHVVEAPQPESFFAIPTEFKDLELRDMLRLFYSGGVGHKSPPPQ